LDEITYAQLAEKYSASFRVMADSMLEALYEDARLILPFLKRKSLAGFHSTTERFPKKPKLAAAAIADGVDMTNTPYAPSYVNLTVGEVGLLLTLTDLARFSTLQEMAEYGREAGEALAEKMLTDITALFSGFSNSVGTTTVDLTEQQYRDAKTQLYTRRIKGPYVAVLYTQQVNDLETSIGSTIDAAANTGSTARAETNDLSAGPSLDYGTLFNTRIIVSTTVPVANAGADSAAACSVRTVRSGWSKSGQAAPSTSGTSRCVQRRSPSPRHTRSASSTTMRALQSSRTVERRMRYEWSS
jgi:hypothetical protein